MPIANMLSVFDLGLPGNIPIVGSVWGCSVFQRQHLHINKLKAFFTVRIFQLNHYSYTGSIRQFPCHSSPGQFFLLQNKSGFFQFGLNCFQSTLV